MTSDRDRGALKVAVELLRMAIGPLEVSAAVGEDEDGGESMESLLANVKRYVQQYDTAALATGNALPNSNPLSAGLCLHGVAMRSDCPACRAEGADKLHDAIMNIPCDASSANTVLLSAPLAYAMGHRDARHAAAELALSVIPEQPVASHLAVSPAVSPQAGPQIDESAKPLLHADEQYRKAVAIVLDAGKASVSLVQRKLCIRYSVAQELVSRMVRDGIAGFGDTPGLPNPHELLSTVKAVQEAAQQELEARVERRIAEAVRLAGLTLLKKQNGYEVRKLGPCVAQENPQGAALSAQQPSIDGRPKGTPGGVMAGCTNSEQGEVEKNAARYAFLRSTFPLTIMEECFDRDCGRHPSIELDAVVDAGIAEVRAAIGGSHG